MLMVKIGIVGGGHTGTVYAGYLSHQGHDVSVLTSHPERWARQITIEDRVLRETYQGNLDLITSDACTLVQHCTTIIVTLPVYALASFVASVLPAISSEHIFYVSPGSGAKEYPLIPLRKKGATIVGLQRVVFISRIKTYGHSAILSGTKPKLVCGILGPNNQAVSRLEKLFGIPVETTPTYFPISLGGSNPILHSSRLRSLVGNADPYRPFPANPLFYEEWNDKASGYFFDMDRELTAVCHAYSALGGDLIGSLAKYYESDSLGELTAKISGIPAFRGITSPMNQKPDGTFTISYSSRYFTEDIMYGLSQIAQLGDIAHIDTPHIKNMLKWAQQVTQIEKPSLDLGVWGLHTIEDVHNFYLSRFTDFSSH